MIVRASTVLIALLALTMPLTSALAATSGDVTEGAKLFQACAACHSLVPNRNMTGPSLAGIFGRQAGTLKSFERYSPAITDSKIVWDAATLDRWLQNPARMIPENRMLFNGVSDTAARADIIAFLKQSAEQPGSVKKPASNFHDLKTLGPDSQVTAIRYCHDTYHVTTADGQTADFWENNLRFKTDSSQLGPAAGKPVILGAGMMGDRASVFFAAPEEIDKFVKHHC